MKRTYNRAISQRANDRLRRRARAVQVQKQILALAAILLISLAILLGSRIRALASSDRAVLHKYYTSIRVENRDTLWQLADAYVVDGFMDRDDFIREVSELNGLSDGQIHSGSYIIIPYYSTEQK